MNKIILYLIGVFLLPLSAIYAQESSDKTKFNPLEKSTISLYEDYDFKSEFVVHINSDKTNHFCLIDKSQFKSDFEFLYFHQLANQAGCAVIYNHGVPENMAWLVSKKTKTKTSTLEQILRFKESSSNVEEEYTEIQKNNFIESLKNR